MYLKYKQKLIIGVTLLVVACLIVSSVFVYFEFFKEEEKIKEREPEKIIDNRISPFLNQGLTIEVLRIRHRGLMDKMLTLGTSWRDTPSFYWKTTADGEECDSLGNIGSYGIFDDWDSILQECRVNYKTEQEQETSEVTITIVEQTKSGLLKRKTVEHERETIHVTYDYRTGRWDGRDDSFMDDDGYGHYVGETFEVWFNIYQSDFDHDGIPYWTEVNILGTDPRVDDSKPRQDPDNDGIPSSWEWKWGYDPHVWDDHVNLDPDVDGIENIEEYQMRKYFADPYQPDIYIEADGMQKKGLIDTEHIFYKESQQMLIERFAQHGINIYIDDGWPDNPVNGGGEMLPFIDEIDEVVGGQVLSFYEHNFPDERKGIFRYLIVANKLGWCTPSKYNAYDTILVGNGIKPTFKTRLAFTPRYQRVCVAKGVLHEMGHSMGVMPCTYEGVDIMGPVGVRYPNMPDEDYQKYLENYHSIMNYKYIWGDRKLFDYSDGSNDPPYDQNDWEYFYLPSFQIDAISYEESIDETFEDFEVLEKYPEPVSDEWIYDENLTEQYTDELSTLTFVKNADCNLRIYVKVDDNSQQPSDRNIRVYAQPQVYPTYALWSLVAEGNLDPENNIQFYSMQNIIDDVMSRILQEA